MSAKLNILVLHKLGDPLTWRTAVRDLEYMLPTYAPEHNHIVHPADLPLPEFIKDIDFHAIVMGPTFLGTRYTRRQFSQVLKKYDFIRESHAFKIAMPQDDYNCSGILDRWMVDWHVDLVYTVCPDHWSVLYPTFSLKGRIKQGYTGYISNSWVKAWSSPKPFDSRSIDVSYRSKKLPPNFGRLGYAKGVIGDLFKAKIDQRTDRVKYTLDISTDPKDFIFGPRWHAFVENSKFCLTTNSGSSLLDPEGTIRKCVSRYQARFPKASFEKVENHCFPGEDGKYVFTAISPRNIEAALAETVQIATPGSYSGLLESEKDYIPIQPDCANISDVIAMMKDHKKTASIARQCKESVLDCKDLWFEKHVTGVIQDIEDGQSGKRITGTDQDVMDRYTSAYRQQIRTIEKFYWKKHRLLNKVRYVAAKCGARRLLNYLGV
jgi:hypothetical protein